MDSRTRQRKESREARELRKAEGLLEQLWNHTLKHRSEDEMQRLLDTLLQVNRRLEHGLREVGVEENKV